VLDAPVSGGVTGAAAGTLTFMAGGTDAGLALARPVLLAMGRAVVHCGPPGAGQTAKIVNNLLLGVTMAGVCEALNLAEALGMDPARATEVINASSGRCWSSDSYNPAPGVMSGVPSENGYAGGFAAKLMLKDMGLAALAAEGAGVELPIGKHAREIYQRVADEGLADKDFGVVFKWLKDQRTRDEQ
jgi:3-hydroxyisobutyrate dehydrogenase